MWPPFGSFDSGEYFVGLAFTNNSNLCKAWLRINVPSWDTCVIEELAYDSDSGVVITTGAGLSNGINNISGTDVSMHWLAGNIIINAPGIDFSNARLSIYDLTGKEVFLTSLQSSHQTLPFNGHAASVYIASIYLNSGQAISRKILVE